MSAFGERTRAEELPAFAYTAGPVMWDPIIDPPSTRHWVHLGNRRITLVADSDGLSGLWDEHTGCRWIAEHTGVSRLGALSTDAPRERCFGPTFSRVRAVGADAELERTVLCPEGEVPWVLIRVVVRNRGDGTMRRP